MAELPFTFRQLRYLVALVDARGYRRAADLLHISQPPLTQQMQALERQLGVELFDRSSRRLQLTLAGETMYQRARALVGGADEAGRLVQAVGRGQAGRLRVGLTDDHLNGPAFDRLLAVLRQHPLIEIETRIDETLTLVSQLEADELDLVIANEPAPTDPERFQRYPLASSCVVAVAKTGLPGWSKKLLPVAELGIHPLILMPARSRAPFALQCRRIIADAIRPIRVHETSSVAIGLRLVQAGLGVLLASEHSLPRGTDSCSIRRLDSSHAELRHVLLAPKRRVSPALDQLIVEILGPEAASLA
jgi:DNA-binding transcriptional LysR family regulator